MLNLLPSFVILGLAAVAAAFLALNRWSPPGHVAERRAASWALAFALVVQGVHFAEEVTTGFHDRLGPLLGLQGMPFSGFVAFNLLWLGIWVASVPAIRSAWPVAFFAAWFLAIAGMVNGIAHPLLGLAAGGYFPGLLSSPFIAIASIWLWLQLRRATQRRDSV